MLDVVDAHYARRQLLARRTADSARTIWGEIDPMHLSASWASLVRRVGVLVAAAQLRAAGWSEEYVDELVGSETAAGTINPLAFAGIASDGRPLVSLLEHPVVRTKTAIAFGHALEAAVQIGGNQLAKIVATQVQDAGRVADGVGVTARKGVGWIRELRTPSCSRCIVLAGRWYRWSDGFDRHPNCDCTHRPAKSRSDASPFNEKKYFSSLSAAEQDRVFTVNGAQAIRDGADIGQVVNARRGMQTAGSRVGTTIEGTTKRGLAGRRASVGGAEFSKRFATGSQYQRVRLRLMPEEIYRIAPTRDQALELLRRHAYIV